MIHLAFFNKIQVEPLMLFSPLFLEENSSELSFLFPQDTLKVLNQS